MLSRVADNLYWMSRYLERAEYTSRLIEVNLNLMLDQSIESAAQRWIGVLAALGTPAVSQSVQQPYAIAQALTFDLTNASSVVSCIMAARENARQVREQISSEMWEELNRLFHEVKRADSESLSEAEPVEFLAAVITGVHLLQGVTDSTMSHGEGWQFIHFGRFLERGYSVTSLLDAHFGPLAKNGDGTGEFEPSAGIGLLRSCNALEAYCKVYTAEIHGERIAEFLLLNDEFPHSVRFAIDRVQTSLEAIHKATNAKADGINRLAGRLGSMLGYAQIQEIMAGGLHRYLSDIRRQCGQIHQSANDLYVTYPVESALDN